MSTNDPRAQKDIGARQSEVEPLAKTWNDTNSELIEKIRDLVPATGERMSKDVLNTTTVRSIVRSFGLEAPEYKSDCIALIRQVHPELETDRSYFGFERSELRELHASLARGDTFEVGGDDE